MLSIVIPSRNEIFLDNTIRDVLEKATGEIEIFPILDGYEPDTYVDDPRVKYIHFRKGLGKRQGINTMVAVCKGEFVMSLDAHCMMDKGFDEKLAKEHQPNWVQVPRRNRLDAENWCLQIQGDGRPPIDYEYIMYPPKYFKRGPKSFHGFRWDERTKERWDIPIDDIITFQGSCWFMTKDWFKKMGFMDYRYENWGQEAEEISFTTWKNGGECKVNKKTWYAHLHKGAKYGRMYFLSKSMTHRSYEYSYKKWARDPDFHKLVEKFMPMPNWRSNWREKL